MIWVAMQKRFKYHTKCKAMQLNHLCFADDMLVFSKVEYQDVMLMLRGLEAFSEASGLKTNAAKSNIFSTNTEKQTLGDLCEVTGYTKVKLPFRYLGVPVSAKRLSSGDCEILVDKMTWRLRTWRSRNLSYDGRVILVNSVLVHMHVYWASIFLLPKRVMKEIIAICRNFIWSGQVNSNQAPLIALERICATKREGGLGIQDRLKWNEAAITKYVWNVAEKADNLWVKWVNHIYIYIKMKSGGNVNQVKTPAGIGRKYAVLKTNSRQTWLEMGATGNREIHYQKWVQLEKWEWDNMALVERAMEQAKYTET
ncbi:uncharacterized protein LOC129900029 [Solanum dulcamara]|uniref:uncharacterized protein LOC129900029 n=1 Tax=Solanum dulcamara TaxID=45834 RepID=UPI0024867565|nr:uncharacterized protein LOC129900029 [Solanum dulcamara]